MANRNAESRFAQIPRAEIRRARFKRDFSNITTINEGDLVPLYVDEVLPGDTISCDLNGLIRMSTPLYPVMDNCYLDTYAFFVPCRLLWEHWENLMGQNDQSFWAEKTDYSVPQTTAPSTGWDVGTIADYMGIPTGIKGISVNSMPFRAYARIWNEWFRDENLQQPVVQDIDDANNTGSNTGTGLNDAQNGGLPLKVAKYHDYFTSCLPEPQKGEAATIPISLPNEIPVTTSAATFTTPQNGLYMSVPGSQNGPASGSYNYAGIAVGKQSSNHPTWVSALPSEGTNADPVASQQLAPYNLVALAADAANISITVNELRQAIAIQHILEADARGGTRYTELLAHEFGVTSPDSRLQRSEYLGGTRVPININQVIQQSATTDASPQGNTAAYSMTTLRNKMCNYSAVEHGYLLILGAIRVDHSYQQGLARMWTRKGRFDFYHPMLANLGEMAVLNKEIYCQGTEKDDEVFGYQEAWADYRYHPNIVTGEMRSSYVQTLDAWHYADYYKELPTLSSTWIQEGEENIDRTLAVESENSHQFICDFYFDQTWTRPMPIYSVPGLNTI
ncbi:major capsid protein [Chicken microvirus mg4_115]|nr:major capsid protein [Chicken microvirus mg4_115]